MLWIIILALVGMFVVLAFWKRPVKMDREIAESIAQSKRQMIAESQARVAAQQEQARAQAAQQDPGAGSAV
jgi:hypothetical protein